MRALLLLLLLLQADAQLRVSVYPRVMFAGAAVRVTCRVPRHADNRKVEWGVENWTSSERQLDGEKAWITHEWIFENIPCDAGNGFCQVTQKDGKIQRVFASLNVACRN